jgi:RHS repeat-associated protein
LTTSGGTETLTYAWLPISNLQTEAIANSQNSASTLTQTFAYDTVNRLISAVESGGSSEWTQYYGYDRFGNRSLLTGGSFNTSFIPHTGVTPQASAPSTIGQTVSGPFSNNQWTGATYDAAGNLETDATVTTTSSAKYDAENRLLTVNDPTLSATPNFQYYYDGNGHRVMKVLCSTSPCSTTTSGAEITTYVYDPSGQLAAEYGSPSSVSGTQYLFADHLGSTRILASSAGVFTRCFDYAPFGEELTTGMGSRGNCYTDVTYPSATPEAETAKFTSKERDAESGLDYFGARYFSSAQGRFTSPDWSASPEPVPYADLSNPQSLNLYSYMRNNPLSGADPDGHCDWSCWSQFGSGVASTTYQPIVQAVSHPLDTLSGLGQAIAHPVDTAIAIGNAVVDTTAAAMSGDPNAVGKVAGTIASTLVTAGVGKAASALGDLAEAGDAARGLSKFGGSFLPAESTPGGGTLVLSTGTITQSEVSTVVSGAMYQGGPINILTGAHGSPAGGLTPDITLFNADVQKFGGLPGVAVQDVTKMTPGQIKQTITGPGTTIGAFCNSAACLGQFK